MMEENPTLAANCIACSDPDDGTMVTCSKCLHCFHRSCCDVGDDVFAWRCQECMEQNVSHNLEVLSSTHEASAKVVETSRAHLPALTNEVTEHTPASRTISKSKKQLQLQQLEEEMLLKQEFLRRKYQLLYLEADESQQIDSVRPMGNSTENATISNPSCVQNYQHDTNINRQCLNTTPTVNKESAISRKVADQHAHYQYLAQSQTQNRLPYIALSGIPRDNSQSNIHDNQSQQNINMTDCQNMGFNTNSYNVNNTGDSNNSGHRYNTNSCEGNHTTMTQIMARQNICRDLPSFNGDPREWPMFISTFEHSSRAAGYTNEENLIRLQKCLHGKAREAVRNCLLLPDMVPDIIRTLKMYYGRPECIIKNLIEDVRKHTLPRGKLEAVIEFAFAVKNLCATIRASRLEEYLINPTLLQELVDKLPADAVLQWALHSKDIHRPSLTDFSDWLYMIAEATCKVTVPVFDTNNDKRSSKREGRLNTHKAQNLQQQCYICNDPHKLTQCDKFKNLSVTARWDVIKAKNLCRICLGKHRRRCWFQKQCGVNGCSVQHNTLLHNDEMTASGGIVNNHRSVSESESYYRIVPVTLYGNKKSITIYALMDDGSTLTLLEQRVADLLDVEGINDPLCIRWTGDVTRYENNSKRLNLKISSDRPNSKMYPLSNVYTVESLNLSSETLNVESAKRKYTHLENIPLQGYTNVVPSMIIGVNNPNLISSIRIREGGWHQPVASKTRLGWTIFGGGSKAVAKLNFHRCCCNKIHNLVKQFFSDESEGISSTNSMPMSKEDEKALQILNKTCVLKDGRYEVGLLWKVDPPELPNSLPTAMKRLKCIKQKAERDPKLAEILKQQIINLLEKGYAEKLPISVLQENISKVWYLPTFIVKNPNKPNKIRLVWDAAAKSGGAALNDFLLKGPDLLMPLMNILFKFRMGEIAVCGDIAEMFHRIEVRKEDAAAQRFLWWDENNSVVVYQLNVLTFGASCSPCISHFVRDKNAEHFGKNQRVINAITKQHYVDDFIDSANTVEEAIELALNVRDVHAMGGFHMRNWSSNSPEVLKALGKKEEPEQRFFENNEKTTQFEKILGLYWDPKNDVFKMNLKFVRLRRPILSEDLVPTKREVLQVLMSVFDPLGFVACFMSYLKVVLQEVWRRGIDWDQPLNDDLFCKWKNWLTFLPTITKVGIPRCYSLVLKNPNYIAELHTFVDASEDAYAAVSYFRIALGEKIEIKLVAAKAKVAPLRPLSIPRLELQAAIIGVRLMKTITSHEIILQRKVMWTDSRTVLSWLAGDPRKYKQFVMFRVAEILKLTDINEWRWVPSLMNVADFATKFRPANDNYREWFEGPSWLKLPESQWPTISIKPGSSLDIVGTSEIRPRYLNIHTRNSIISINFEYFSSFYRLNRAVANWVMYVERKYQKLQQQKIVESLNAIHLTKAKNIILKMVQMTGFEDEYFAVLNGRPNVKGGVFDKLNVYIDKDGLVRVRNRAQYATAACGPQRDLIILPGKHHVTKLIIMNYHRAYHHLNHETALNEIRQIYFILRLRVIYKVVRRSCQQCKIEAAKPVSPQMAPLPPARLGAFQRPFTFVGVDYFGPISVTFGRKSLKRWGVIFTCLTIRAVHIEIAHSLSTDSFLMTLKNFIARRGLPAEIYSDNGTNFRGADRFLREEAKNIKLDTIQAELAHKGISWKFNPPAAPHMGGAWERLIRSIKTILGKISPAQKFTDESLRSALMEVESIINSRPLTYVSLETEDQEAITPNHFLLGSSNGSKPFCTPENIDHRMSLRQSEMFANMFWRRFVKEMLPTLTRRSKWTQRAKAIEVGDIVLVVDENADRNCWLRGRVIEVSKARDGQVRKARVKRKSGVIERPAVKLAVLDVGNNLE